MEPLQSNACAEEAGEMDVVTAGVSDPGIRRYEVLVDEIVDG